MQSERCRGEWCRERVNILGVRVSAIGMNDATTAIQEWIRDRTPNYVCVTGVHGVMESQEDTDLARIHNLSGLTVPDGMPLVWMSHKLGVSVGPAGLRTGTDAGDVGAVGPARLPQLLLWRRCRDRRPAQGYARATISGLERGRNALPAVPPTLGRRRPRDRRRDHGYPAGYRMGRSQHPETRTVDAEPPGTAPSAGFGRRGRRFRLSVGQQKTSSCVDAAARPRMAISHAQRAAAPCSAIHTK